MSARSRNSGAAGASAEAEAKSIEKSIAQVPAPKRRRLHIVYLPSPITTAQLKPNSRKEGLGGDACLACARSRSCSHFDRLEAKNGSSPSLVEIRRRRRPRPLGNDIRRHEGRERVGRPAR